MEIEPKPEVSQVRCCIACLKDESEIRVENSDDSNITKIYNTLVQGEINQIGLPSVALCDFCKETMMLIVEFQKQCLKSIDSLRSKLDFSPEIILIKEEKLDIDEVIEVNIVEKSQEKDKEISNTELSSDEDDTSFNEPAPADDDDEEETDEESDSDDAPLVKVDVRKRGKYKMKPIPRKNKKEEKRYWCKQCDCSYVKPLELTRHTMKRHQGGSQCKYCRHVFLDKEEFKQHLKEEETKTRPDPTVCCEQCGYTTKWKPNLRKHITKYHTPDQPKLICDLCGKCYIFRAQFKHHFITNHMEKTLVCNECGRKFSFNSDLQKHIQDYHTAQGALKGPNALVKCKYCDKTMKGGSLQQHIRLVHHSFKKHKCTICTKAFTRVSVLKRHILTHDPERTIPKNDKNISCNECGLSFSTKPELTQHQITTHLDKETLARNYVSCKFCSEKLRPSSMQMHVIRKHIDARRFKCDQCDKAFNNTRGLQLHKYSHTGERPFNCNICTSGYYQIDTLRKHYEKVHNIQYTVENVRRLCG